MEIRTKRLAKVGVGLIVLLFLVFVFLIGLFIGVNLGMRSASEVWEKEYKKLLEIQEGVTFVRLLEEIIQRESDGIHNVYGKDGEYGLCQFKEETFYWLASLAGVKKPNWKSEEQQIAVLAWAVRNGYGNLWSVYKEVKEAALGRELGKKGG